MPRKISGMGERVERDGSDEPDETRAEPSIRQKVPGSGRTKGTPNKIAGQIRKDAGSFFRSCTSDNLKFRRRLKEFCESGEVLKHSHTLAVLLAHGLGKPTPKVEQPEPKSPLLFVMQAGRAIGQYDPLAEKAAALLARKQAALPEAKPDAYEPPDPTDPDALVVIEPDLGTVAASMIRPAG
jgi:hypothetical protein